MKYLLLLILVSFISVLSSCGDSATTPTEPTVLFTLDTLSASVEAGVTGSDTVSQSFSQSLLISQVKIEYRLQSNVDSSFGSTASYIDSTNGLPTPPSSIIHYVYSPVDSLYSFTYSVTAQPFFAGFNLGLIVTQPQTETKYIRMTGIKVTKVK
ncbi:MAG: hypothetical protein ABI543_05185 [Ignavibacteria bacterium]